MLFSTMMRWNDEVMVEPPVIEGLLCLAQWQKHKSERFFSAKKTFSPSNLIECHGKWRSLWIRHQNKYSTCMRKTTNIEKCNVSSELKLIFRWFSVKKANEYTECVHNRLCRRKKARNTRKKKASNLIQNGKCQKNIYIREIVSLSSYFRTELIT